MTAPIENAIRAAATAGKQDDPARLKKAVAEFESLFINEMLKTMRETVNKSGLFHGGTGEDMYTSLLDMELSKKMADSGGIGLSKILLEDFSRNKIMPGLSTEPVPPSPALAPGVEVKTETQAAPALPQAPAAHAPLKKDTFMFPLKSAARISSGFGDRIDPFTGDMKFHHGVDIAANSGTTVYSAAPGKVVFSGEKGGYGKCVEILHDNGMVTRYGHNSKNLVKEGDIVSASQKIAEVGSTGRSTGPHLHFEVLKDGAPVNPAELYA